MSRFPEGHAGTEGVGETPYDAVYAGVCGEVQLEDESYEEVTVAILASIASSGYVIAPAQDVLTADQRAAIGRLWNWAEADSAGGYDIEPQAEADLELIRQLLAGGTDGQ